MKDRSVVLLFLQGGPSHIEFFDPKMSAPEDVRSITGEVKTEVGRYPELALVLQVITHFETDRIRVGSSPSPSRIATRRSASCRAGGCWTCSPEGPFLDKRGE